MSHRNPHATPLLLLLLTGCLDTTIIVRGPPGEGSGGSGGESDGEVSSGGPGASDSGVAGSGSTGGGGSSDDGSWLSTGAFEDSTSGTGEGECLLPEGPGSWCEVQLEVVQTIGCAGVDDPASCYDTVAGQYDSIEDGLAEAADCNLMEPGCDFAILRCREATGPSTCHLFDHAGCVRNATDVGVAAADAATACMALSRVYP